jgi:hypothetical protein
VVDGSPNVQDPARAGSFFLMHALLPVKEADKAAYHIQPRLVSPRQAYPGLLDGKDLCILVNAPLAPGPDGAEALRSEFVDQLATFVREGHGLILFGGDRVDAEPYNRLFYQQRGLLPLELAARQENPAGAPFHLDRGTAGSTFFSLFRTEEYYKSLNRVKVQRYLEVLEPAKKDQAAESGTELGRVLMRYDNGHPALVSRKVGAGEVLLVTTSADLSWTDWPSWETGTMYVPFVDLALNHVLHGQAQGYNVAAGQPLRYHPPERDATRAFAILGPDGQRVRLGPPEMIQGRPVVTAAETPRAGIYHLVYADAPEAPAQEAEQAAPKETDRAGVPFAVVPDPRETESLECLSDAQIDERLGFKPVHLTAGEETGALAGKERQSHEWTLWVLAAVLATCLGETALAWLCGRPW